MGLLGTYPQRQGCFASTQADPISLFAYIRGVDPDRWNHGDVSCCQGYACAGSIGNERDHYSGRNASCDWCYAGFCWWAASVSWFSCKMEEMNEVIGCVCAVRDVHTRRITYFVATHVLEINQLPHQMELLTWWR